MESLRLQKKEKIHYFLNINIIHQLYSDFTSSTCTYSCAYIFSLCNFITRVDLCGHSSRYRIVPNPHAICYCPFPPFWLRSNCWSPLICFLSPLLCHFKNTILMESCSMHTSEICFFFTQHNEIHPSSYIYQFVYFIAE